MNDAVDVEIANYCDTDSYRIHVVGVLGETYVSLEQLREFLSRVSAETRIRFTLPNLRVLRPISPADLLDSLAKAS